MDIKTAHILGIHLVGSIAVTALLLAASGCGGWTDWSVEQAARIPILGEPVDEAAVRDAVATVLGESDMHAFAIWFSDSPVVNPLTKEKQAGVAVLCTRHEDVRVFLPSYVHCVFDTSLVHELVHRFDRYILGTPCAEMAANPHPMPLFGDDGDGGLVGEINSLLRERYCR